VNGPARPAAPSPARSFNPTFERQILNARYAGEGDYQLRALQARLAAEPDNLQLRLELARHYESVGSRELALEHYRLAAGRFPDSREVHLGMAKCLRAMGLEAEAADGLEKFLGRHPEAGPELASWLGILRDESGQWQRGEPWHRAALKLAPDQDRLHNNLGYNLLQQTRFAEAAEEFRRALALRPDSAIARNNLGLALASQPEEALRHWQKGSDQATAHNNLAAALIEQGRYAEARKELDAALSYNRNHPAALANLRLISQLDGQPTTLSARPAPRSGWKRFLVAFWRGFAGIEEQAAR
jgi:tetratricopeptide (TPR) repeat protein